MRHWLYVCIDLIASKLASIFPNLAYVTDQPKPGLTVKAGQRGLLNLMGRGFGGNPYVGPGYDYGQYQGSDYASKSGAVSGEYVGTDGWREKTVWEGNGRILHDGNPTPSFGGMNSGHSFLSIGEYYGKALSVVKPHEELEPLENDHLLRRLIQNPNPYDTFFSYTYEKWMFGELTGVIYEWLVPNRWGVPCERWVIPSHWVWPRTGGSRVPDGGARDRMRRNGQSTYEWEPDGEVGDGTRYRAAYVPYDNPYADRLIQYYEVRPWGGMGSAGILRLPPNEVIMTKWPSPINKIDGYSKLAAIAQWIDSEESISKSRWSQFQNQARPELWVKLPPGYEDADDNRIARIEAKFLTKWMGELNYGKPIFTSAGTEIEQISFTPTEMAYFDSENQLRDMILSTFRIPPSAVGISQGMTYGSILATLASLCSYCLDPRLTMAGENDTKHLASRWDEKSSAFSSGFSIIENGLSHGVRSADSVTGSAVAGEEGETSPLRIVTRGNGGASGERKVRIWFDDCVPADPSQVNSDLETDGHFHAITPNEVRALRGRKPYRYGGDDPFIQGPAGPMPYPMNTKEDLTEVAELLKPMAEIGAQGRGRSEEQQTAHAAAQHGESMEDIEGQEERVDLGVDDPENAGATGEGTSHAGGNGSPATNQQNAQAFHARAGAAGSPPKNPNGKPQKNFAGVSREVGNNKSDGGVGVNKGEDVPAIAGPSEWEGVKLSLPLRVLAAADFVRLPGEIDGTNCGNCKWQSQGQCWFPDLAGQEVNETICCKFWDADGVERPWQEKAWIHPAVRQKRMVAVRESALVGEVGDLDLDKGALDTVQAAGKWLASKWQELESRYGRKQALAMAAAMIATGPLPGSIPAIIAVAEGVRGIHGYFARECGGVLEKMGPVNRLALVER